MNEILTAADTLAFYGGSVKALGGGKIEGYGILFTTPRDPDLQQEFFRKDTEYFLDVGESRPLFYRHGQHPQLKARMLGKALLTELDEVGAFFQSELNLRDSYEKAIYKLAELGKLGFSSGAISHLVRKKAVDGGKSFEILSWPIGELSLTPNPVEPRTAAFPVKDMGEDLIDLDGFAKSLDQEEFDQQFSIDGIPSIKAFCEAVAPNSLKDGSHRSESAANAAKEFITITKILGEAYDSYASRLVKRTESRFLKQGREIDPSTVAQVESTLSDMEKVDTAFQSVKDALLAIKKISDMSVAEQRAMNERARAEMWNFCRISGLKPEELENAGTGTS